jgi:hypothetical protein
MTEQRRILLQTTIPAIEDDWHIGRFSLLAEHLRAQRNGDGERLYDVTARDREAANGGNDPVLSSIDESDFDQLWLFAVDAGDGLTVDECEAITRFRERGGGIYSTRDHFDLGSSLCTLGGIGAAHYFNSKNPDPDPERRCRDDQATLSIDYPNYHSGANGDYQTIAAADHELLKRVDGSVIEHFPAHPHEGGVGAPNGDGRVIATGVSKATGCEFNIIVALEGSGGAGRAIADSSFHHIVDYNWDVAAGCPSFVEEAPGSGYLKEPEKLDDIKQFVANAALWLCSR